MNRKERKAALHSGNNANRRRAEDEYIADTIREVYEAERNGSTDTSIDLLVKDFERYANAKN